MKKPAEVSLVLACLGLAATAQEIRFPADAVVDVTSPPYGVVPNDGRDDAASLQRAISDHVDSGRFLFLPPGVYDLATPLVATNAAGTWRAHLTLQGAGRDLTILRLADRATAFGDPAAPRAVLTTGSHWQDGDRLDGGGNKAFRNNVLDLTIDTGRGNPGAIGIAYAVSNIGTLENVSVRDPEGTAAVGIAMTRAIPGPGLLSRVVVQGFGIGIDYADVQYGMTIEHAVLTGQREAGIRTTQNVLHIRGLRSTNRVCAIRASAPQSMLTVLDADLQGGTPETCAIDAAGSLLLRDIRTGGYASALRCAGRTVPGDRVVQHVHPAAIPNDTPSVHGLLEIRETPRFRNADLNDWQAVGPRQAGEADDTAVIQRAIDTGKGTVYFPTGRTYFLSDTVVVRGSVRQVLGMGAEISLGAAREPFGDRANPRPLFRIDPGTQPVVFLEHLFFNAQYPGEVLIENNTPSTLVIRHCSGWVGAAGARRAYRNTPRATGEVFVEDVFLPGWEFRGQTVWARQFNPENWDGDGSEAQVLNHGGRLWILGFKTEGPAPFLRTVAGGTTELLGAYNYVSAAKLDPLPAGLVPYPVIGSRAALTFATDNFGTSDYPVYVESRDGEAVRTFRAGDLPPRGGHRGDRSFAVPLLGVP